MNKNGVYILSIKEKKFNYKKFFLEFFIIFIVAQLLVGIISWFLYDISLTKMSRGGYFVYFFKEIFTVTFVVFSFIYFVKKIKLSNNKIFRNSMISFLSLFYLLSIYCITFCSAYTPIVYLSGFVYNGISHGVWGEDFKTSIIKRQIEIGEQWKRGKNA